MTKILENIRRIIPHYALSRYQNIDLNSLICYSSYLLEKNGIPLTFENIYVSSYLSFPERFSLVGFLEFPDGARINRSILQCLPKYQNLLIGNAKKGYTLTKLGLSRAQDVERKLKLGYSNVPKEEDVSKRTLDYKKRIKELEQKSAFKKFQKGNIEEIGLDEIFEFLDLSPYANRKQISDQLKQYLQMAESENSDSFKNFIFWIKSLEGFKRYLSN